MRRRARDRRGEQRQARPLQPADALGGGRQVAPDAPLLQLASSCTLERRADAARSASRLRWIASGSTSSIRSPITLRSADQRLALERRSSAWTQRSPHRGDHRRGIGLAPRAPAISARYISSWQRLVTRERIAIDLGQSLSSPGWPLDLEQHGTRSRG
jgi:hypothetical protein